MAPDHVVDTKLEDLDAYDEYTLTAKPIVEFYGGEYLARGGYTTVPENELWTPTRLVIVRFPSRKNAETFLTSHEYAPIKVIRRDVAESTITIIDGV